MKKLLGLFLFAVSGLLMTSSAEAGMRGSKSIANINYTTTVSTISAGASGTVYGVILSTGTAGTDHFAMWDIAAAGATAIGTNTGLKLKVNVSSATQNTVVLFDPPVLFKNGIIAANSAATNWAAVIWEPGRVMDRQ